MAAKVIAFVCLQFAVFNTITAQCLNRVVPGCGPNLYPIAAPVAETILPNQLVIGPNYGSPVVDLPYGIETVANQVMPTTIIQDSTVANNLANALQLLVVSNLLSNTLNSPGEVVVPGMGYGTPVEYNVMAPMAQVMPQMSPCGFGPYNYIY